MKQINEFLFLGDTHWGARGDNPIIQAMQVRYFKEYLFPYILNNGIKTVIQFGDLMDKRKSTNHETLYTMRTEFLDFFENNKITLIVLVGNHDIYYRESNQISTIEEFLRGYKYCIPITKPARINTGHGTKIDIIPWINDENKVETANFINNSNSEYCIGHFEFSGFKFAKNGQVAEKGMGTALFKKYKHVYSGHFHTRSTQGNITYIGTPYELTWSDYDDPKGVTIFNGEDGSTKFIENPLTLHNRIVYNDAVNDYNKYDYSDFSKFEGMLVEVHVNTRTKKKQFATFMKEVYNSKPANVEVVDNTNKVTYESDITVNASTDTKTLLDNGVDSVQKQSTELSKEKLQKIADEIYSEAQNQSGI